MKSYVISQNYEIDYEGNTTTPVAIRRCSEQDVITEVGHLNANVTTVAGDMVAHYYTYNEIPEVGFATTFDLPSKHGDYNLISLRNIMNYHIEKDHVLYNNRKDIHFISRATSFKGYFLEQHCREENRIGVSEDQISNLFDEVFSQYVARGVKFQ